VDFDGDGILDLVSGSYDPGDLYLFRGQGKGRFAAAEVLRDKSGKPILKVPNQKNRVESFGSWMALVDWNDRGVLDILVGTFDGMMFLRRNEGTRTKPVYSDRSEWVMAGNKRLRVPGGAHANPVIADWDGDGLWDILTGSADGGVYWYRNVGKKGSPQFARPVALVPKHEGMGYGEMLDSQHEPRPGIRTQIAVADYGGHGKLDLLVGDFCTYLQVKPDLTAEQRKQFDSTRDQLDKSTVQLRARMENVRAKYKTAMRGVPKSEWNNEANSAKWQKMYKDMQAAADYVKLRQTYDSLEKDLAAFVVKGRNGEADSPHGYVWLFRRK